MRIFFKYSALGILGLALQISFPQFKVNWLVLWVAAAFLERGLGFALVVSALLSLLNSAASVAHPLVFFLPMAVGVLSFALFSRWISLSAAGRQFFLILYLWLAAWLLAQGWTSPWNSLWGLATAGFGTWVLPVLLILPVALINASPFGGRRTGELDYFRVRRRSFSGAKSLRKPFGLQKGI